MTIDLYVNLNLLLILEAFLGIITIWWLNLKVHPNRFRDRGKMT